MRALVMLLVVAAGCGESKPLSSEPACAPAAAAPDAAAPAAAAPASDGSIDRLTTVDGELADGVTRKSDAWADGVWIDMTPGLLADLEQAMGVKVGGEVHFADKVHVMAGYGVDIVILRVGGIAQARPDQLGPVVVTVGGPGVYSDPGPPHPQYLPAKALFDAMTNVPEVMESRNLTRTSPQGRVKCHSDPDPAHLAVTCTLTGAIGSRAN